MRNKRIGMWWLVLALVIALAASACDQEEAAIDDGPAVQLQVGGETYQEDVYSYCWPQDEDNVACDVDLTAREQPAQLVPVAPGDELRFDVEEADAAPGTITVTLLDGPGGPLNVAAQGDTAYVSPTEPGQYRIQVDVQYASIDGSEAYVSYVYGLDVQGEAVAAAPTETPAEMAPTEALAPEITEEPQPTATGAPSETPTPLPSPTEAPTLTAAPTEVELIATEALESVETEAVVPEMTEPAEMMATEPVEMAATEALEPEATEEVAIAALPEGMTEVVEPLETEMAAPEMTEPATMMATEPVEIAATETLEPEATEEVAIAALPEDMTEVVEPLETEMAAPEMTEPAIDLGVTPTAEVVLLPTEATEEAAPAVTEEAEIEETPLATEAATEEALPMETPPATEEAAPVESLGVVPLTGVARVVEDTQAVPRDGADLTLEYTSETNPERNLTATTTTDETGRFAFDPIPFYEGDTLTLSVGAEGYNTQTVTLSAEDAYALPVLNLILVTAEGSLPAALEAGMDATEEAEVAAAPVLMVPTPPPGVPTITLAYTGQRYEPLGYQYCEDTGTSDLDCVQIPSATAARRRITLMRGAAAQLLLDGPRPTDVRIEYLTDAGVKTGQPEERVGDNTILFTVTPEPGNYILVVNLTWEGEEATYYFRVAVTG